MKLLILLLAGVSATLAAEAVLGQFPYSALVFADNEETFRTCDGALVRHNRILTAAHCVYGMTRLHIQLGVIELWNDAIPPTWEAYVTGNEVRIHERFDNYNPYHDDVAIVSLPSADPSILNSPFIGLIDLPSSGDTNLDHIQGTLTGFSYEQPDFIYRLRFIRAPIMPNSWCIVIHGNERIVDSKMCFDPIDVTTPCLEGNGAPLVANVAGRDVVVGFGSIWTSLCDVGHHGIFTRVTSHLTWINEGL